MENVLVNTEKYNGQYVALKDAEDHTVVGNGQTPDEALKKAKQNGYNEPYLLFVPENDSIHIY